MSTTFDPNQPRPTDLGGFQNIVMGTVQEGDLLVLANNPAPQFWMWAQSAIGTAIAPDGTNSDGAFRVYRRIPVLRQGGDNDPSNAAPAGPLPSSGTTATFVTGAVRDANEGKGLPHMIPPVALRALARRFEDGAKKYARNNWMKGIPLSRYQDALMRHLMAWSEGDTTEDHGGAIVWNACCMLWTEDAIKQGKLPAELNDLPYRS